MYKLMVAIITILMVVGNVWCEEKKPKLKNRKAQMAQNKYERSSKKLKEEYQKKLAELQKHYIKDLDRIQLEVMKSGKLSEANLIAEIKNSIQKELNSGSKPTKATSEYVGIYVVGTSKVEIKQNNMAVFTSGEKEILGKWKKEENGFSIQWSNGIVDTYKPEGNNWRIRATSGATAISKKIK